MERLHEIILIIEELKRYHCGDVEKTQLMRDIRKELAEEYNLGVNINFPAGVAFFARKTR